jgi:CRP-like cAMP-binding protein
MNVRGDWQAASHPGANSNRLLAGLPDHSRDRLIAASELVSFVPAQVLCESGQHAQHAYFPISGCIALLARLEDGARSETGLVGSEGMVGSALVLGIGACPQDIVVQGEGSAWRLSSRTLRREFADDLATRRMLTRYLYVVLAQLAQSVACTHFHSVESRLARWLLMTCDRSPASSFFVTHEFLAQTLGARRAGITWAASSLRERGLIHYSRGEVRVIDGAGLKKAACECYRRANETYRDVFG